MAITKINSLGVNLTSPTTFSAGTASLPSITFSGDTNTGVFAPAADTVAFTEGGTEVMRITSDGFVGIGTTSPDFRLDVVRGSTGTVATFGIEGQTINPRLRIDADESNNTVTFNPNYQGATSPSIVFNTGEVERMRINASGSLILAGSTAQKASGTTWSNPSDTRLKDNKQNYTKGLNELLQINVKTWEWNGKAGTTQGDVGIGIIADEIETILPNTIDTYKAKLNKDDIEETDVKRFDATEITWLLLNSVKEQQAIIEQLKARLTALESK